MIILIICGLALLLLMLLVVNISKDNKSDNIFYSFISIAIALSIFLTGLWFGNLLGQIDALKGKLDYKMEVKYELIDSVYTQVDTTFTEIKH